MVVQIGWRVRFLALLLGIVLSAATGFRPVPAEGAEAGAAVPEILAAR